MLGQDVNEALAQCCHVFLIYYLSKMFSFLQLVVRFEYLKQTDFIILLSINCTFPYVIHSLEMGYYFNVSQ